MNLLLGVDVGTSSTKAVLAADDGKVLATARREHATDMPRPGWFEQDANGWWTEIAALCRQLLADTPRGALRGVCCSGMGPCVVLGDGEGRPLRPAILYGVDVRAAAEIEELTATFGADEILDRCGSPLTSQAVGPKLLWLRRHEEKVWDDARLLLMPSSLAVLRLTGEYVLDHHSASQCAPLYSLRDDDWDARTAEAVAPGIPLPRLLWPAETAGHVTRAAAAETGIPAGTPVAAGTVDAWAEAVSAGLRRAGDTMLMYGSTMFLVGLGDRLRPDPRLWLTRWAFPGRLSRAAGLASAGSLTGWSVALTSLPFDELAGEAAAVPAGSDGLVALPYFAGERTPLFDSDARGVIVGLHLGHGRGHIHRALLEATAYAVRHNLETMMDAGDRIERIVAVGGGTQASLWPQIVSDVTGVAQQLPGETIGAAYGDALLAAIASGLVDEGATWTTIATTVEPRADLHERYGHLYGVYRRLYEQTRELVHELADLQRADHSVEVAAHG